MTDDIQINLTAEELQMYGMQVPQKTKGRPPKIQSVFRRDPNRTNDAFRIELDGFQRFHRRGYANREAKMDEELQEVERALAHREKKAAEKPDSSDEEDDEFLDDWFSGWETEVAGKLDDCFQFLRDRNKNIKKTSTQRKNPDNTGKKYKKHRVSSPPPPRENRRKCAERADRRIRKSAKFWR